MASVWQKRQYISVAKALFASGAKANAAWETIANELADAMAKDNPNFDRDIFLHACRTGEVLGEKVQGGPAMAYGYEGNHRRYNRKLGR